VARVPLLVPEVVPISLNLSPLVNASENVQRKIVGLYVMYNEIYPVTSATALPTLLGMMCHVQELNRGELNLLLPHFHSSFVSPSQHRYQQKRRHRRHRCHTGVLLAAEAKTAALSISHISAACGSSSIHLHRRA
jgi:hypothetical protein